MGKKNKNTPTAKTGAEGKQPAVATTLGGPGSNTGPKTAPKTAPKIGPKNAVKAVHGPAGRRAPPKGRGAREPSTATTVTYEDDESRSNDLCLQCDLMTFTVEEAIKTFGESKTQENLHLVLKEIRYLCLEIGRCCGQPPYDSRDDDDASSLSSRRERIFWENLQTHVDNQKPPFQAPPRPPATTAPNANLSDLTPIEPQKDEAAENKESPAAQ